MQLLGAIDGANAGQLFMLALEFGETCNYAASGPDDTALLKWLIRGFGIVPNPDDLSGHQRQNSTVESEAHRPERWCSIS